MKTSKYLLWMIGLAALALASACGGDDAPPEAVLEEAPPAETTQAPPEEPPAEPDADKPEETPAPAEEPKTEPSGPPTVVVATSKGTFKIELNPDRAPGTVKNFLAYVDAGSYDGTIFHRVIPNFMVQGGGFTVDMSEKPTRSPIKNEAKTAGLSNLRGTVAMARTPDPHSATSQFFINHKTNQALDPANERSGWGYCVFGKVVEGMDVVDAIAAVKTGNKGMHGDVPVEPVIIKSVRRAS